MTDNTPAPVDHAALAEELPAVSVCHYCKKVPDVLSMGAALVDRDGGFAVQCVHCVEVGPRESTRKDAIEGWNEFQVRALHKDALRVSTVAAVDGDREDELARILFCAHRVADEYHKLSSNQKEYWKAQAITIIQLIPNALRAHPAGGVSALPDENVIGSVALDANREFDREGWKLKDCKKPRTEFVGEAIVAHLRAAGMTQPPSGYVSEYNGASFFTEHRPTTIPDANIFPVWRAPRKSE